MAPRPKPKPLSTDSWWTTKPPQGFTAEAEKLWNDRMPKTAAGAGMNLWPHEKRKDVA